MSDTVPFEKPGPVEAGLRQAISPISDIIAEARAGRMYILVDHEDRENEGDLVIAAEFADAAAINFMAKYGRGLICLPMTSDRIDHLGLPMMAVNIEVTMPSESVMAKPLIGPLPKPNSMRAAIRVVILASKIEVKALS